ncbi:ankyrin [Xylariaceae sp. AK1471]|nr:ankyrin [Xylariaceae sp. AK1471]
MDPLSLTASVITVVGVADAAARGLKKLIALRGASDAILALNNEISDLRLTLRELDSILQASKADDSTLNEYLQGSVFPSIDTTQKKLIALEKFVESRLKKPDGNPDRLGWLKYEEKIQKHQKDFRHLRVNLGTVLGIISSKSASRLETRLDSLCFVAEQHRIETQALVQQGETVHQAFLQMLERQKLNELRLAAIEKGPHIEPPQSPPLRIQPRGPSDGLSALRMRFLQRRRCSPYCDCACHRTSRLNTPRMLQFLTGTLFVGYNGVTRLTKPCTSECQKSPEGFIAVNYYFPTWLVKRVFAAGARFTNYRGPELSIRMLNVRDPGDMIFQATHDNDALTVQALLSSGEASVLDVQDGTGHSALHLATMESKIDVINVLLQFGAEPYLENGTQETSFDMAWNTILCFKDTAHEEEWCVAEVNQLFPNTAALEERRVFSRIHQVVCKLLPFDLEVELEKNDIPIDEPDADGRTALHWAAGRGDERSVEILLRHGAHPDKADRIGQGPLRSSLKASGPECLNLLIKYGANVMQVDHWEQTCLLASMYYSNPLDFGLPLVKAGIDINAQDSVRRTALLEAIRLDHSDAAHMLVDYGADVNLQDKSGISPLAESIRHNRHATTYKLLQNSFIDTAILDSCRRSILHHAAAGADRDMLRLLSGFKLEGLDPNDRDRDGLTPLDIAVKRQAQENDDSEPCPIDDAWVAAFSLVMEHATQGPPPIHKDEEDQVLEYASTGSPSSSVYFDAR